MFCTYRQHTHLVQLPSTTSHNQMASILPRVSIKQKHHHRTNEPKTSYPPVICAFSNARVLTRNSKKCLVYVEPGSNYDHSLKIGALATSEESAHRPICRTWLHLCLSHSFENSLCLALAKDTHQSCLIQNTQRVCAKHFVNNSFNVCAAC